MAENEKPNFWKGLLLDPKLRAAAWALAGAIGMYVAQYFNLVG